MHPLPPILDPRPWEIRGGREQVTCPRCRTTALGNLGEPASHLAARFAVHRCYPATPVTLPV